MRFFLFLLFTLTTLFAEPSIHEKVLILGVCKNVEKPLPKTIRIIEELASLFDETQIIIYENNSTDATKALLREWAEHNQKVLALSETIERQTLEQECINLTQENNFNRSELIARARNKVLDLALSERYADFSHVIWIDMDFESPLNLDAVVEIFNDPRDWDGVFGYGVDPCGRYFDWYAHRDYKVPLGPELLSDDWWRMRNKPPHWWHVRKWLREHALVRSVNLSPSDDWYPVHSAFGGIGIYKRSSMIGSRYAGIVTPEMAAWTKVVIEEGKKTKHPIIQNYLNRTKRIRHVVRIPEARSGLPKVQALEAGILLGQDPNGIVWRMSCGVSQYPAVCEHVAFHAAMSLKGHGKLYINPRLVMHYNDR